MMIVIKYIQLLCFALFMSVYVVEGGVCFGADLVVTTNEDELNSDGDCSLREAIEAANSDSPVDACSAGQGEDTITFAVPEGSTILLKGSHLSLQGDLIINGPGADLLTISGNNDSRIFRIHPTHSDEVIISGLTLRNGRAGSGGAILIDDGASATIHACNIIQNISTSDNKSEGGGGIKVDGNLTMSNSTIAENSAIRGGGIHSGRTDSPSTRASVMLRGCTISGNTASLHGGGVYHRLGSAMLKNSTISGNHSEQGNAGGLFTRSEMNLSACTVTENVSAGHSGGIWNHTSYAALKLSTTLLAGNIDGSGKSPDLSLSSDASVVSEGFNLLGNSGLINFPAVEGDIVGSPTQPIEPSLEPLADNGGFTQTHLLISESPAIDAISAGMNDCGTALTTDQRGEIRPADGSGNGSESCDIGSVEVGSTSSEELTLIVDFGASENENQFGLPWTHVILQGQYSDQKFDGVHGNDIVQTSYFGVAGDGAVFQQGEKIIITWYNNSTESQTIYPQITFDDENAPGKDPKGHWYGMSDEITLEPYSTAQSVYEIDNKLAGIYRSFAVNPHIGQETNKRFESIICDKIELASADTDIDLFLQHPRQTRTITAHVFTGEGMITPSAEWGQMVDVLKKDDITFTITAGQGMDAYQVLVDGVDVTHKVKQSDTYTFVNVIKDHDIAVGFYDTSRPMVKLNITHGGNGKMSPSGEIFVNTGANAKIKYLPRRWHTYEAMTLDGEKLEKNAYFWTHAARGAYWFKKIDQSHDLHVEFMYHGVQNYRTLEDLHLWQGEQSLPPAGTINPDTITYLGAFRVPEVEDTSAYWGSSGSIAYKSTGDSREANPGDEYPGSLVFIGSNWLATEMSIPEPTLSKHFSELNIARELQPFATVRIGEEKEEGLKGLIYLSQHNRFYFGEGKWSYADRTRPNHGWLGPDLCKPDVQGLWYLGGQKGDNSPIYGAFGLTADDGEQYYVDLGYHGWNALEIPQKWADQYLDGRKILGVGKGLSLFAIAPWDEQSVLAGDWDAVHQRPKNRGKLAYIPLLAYYRHSYGEPDPRKMINMAWGDTHFGIAWLQQGNRSAAIFLGTTGYGNSYYNNGAAQINWNDNAKVTLKFYNPQDLADVAQGKKRPKDPQPYAILDITPYLFHSYFGDGSKPLRGNDTPAVGMTYDKEQNLIYIIERGPHAEGNQKDYPIIHVFHIFE